VRAVAAGARRATCAAALLLATAMCAATPLHAQSLRGGTVAAGIQFQGFDLDDRLGVEAVNLVLVPVGYSFAAGNRLGFDVYTSYARGAALIGGTEFTLAGLTDTRVRANFTAAPWAVVTLGLNLPTGRTGHTDHEARVAAILSSELFGFREANFGIGFGATTGIATAHRFGDTGVGAGVSYRFSRGFEPQADTSFTYSPGNEMRLRVGIDRNIGRNKLTAGVTYQNFARDRIDGHDLFQPGSRIRADVAYSFRTGPGSTWTAFITDVWRAHGDIHLEQFDTSTGEPTGISRTGTQNMLIGGLVGSYRASRAITLQPVVEARMLTREDPGGEGWLVGAGTAMPLRTRGFLVTPEFRLNYGGLQGEEAMTRRVWGGELNLTVSRGPR
jgi:hypothetical protein